MNKIKVIELLNMISKGEEVPKKIEYEGEIYEFNKNIRGYWGGKNKDSFRVMVNWRYLNNEVEILEEEKKIPEKLDHLIGYDIRQFDDLKEYVEITTNDLFGKVNKIIDTLNQVLDYLNSKGE